MEKGMENIVGNTIKVVAWIIFVAGVIGGFVSAVTMTFTTAIIVWVAAIVIGTLLLGLSEVIKLLQQLVDKGN